MSTHMEEETIAFFGASGGVGLAALKHTLLSSGDGSRTRRCIALCRVPSKLTAILPPEKYPNLRIVQGNAHDLAAVTTCLQVFRGEGSGVLVDKVITTIGGALVPSKLSIDDPHVCEKGMSVLLQAISNLCNNNHHGKKNPAPHIICFSTTGISRFGRDIPLLMAPLYHVTLRVPHADKRAMEDALIAASGGGVVDKFTIVRASFMPSDGEDDKSKKDKDKEIRVSLEDPQHGRIGPVAIGYTISKFDAGRWLAENLIIRDEEKYHNKIATITY
ncbi:hypothetical protein F5Y17DRAFT_422845 [Xylariaceae sp. FL0594]|nr:hypothetical protein F5Y17DRAFT_422845 [Xylariaceae sp. FL0594]